jgi:hypothetical protein
VIGLQKSGRKVLDFGKRQLDTGVVQAAVSILPNAKAGQAFVVWSVFWFLGMPSPVFMS